MSQPTQTRTKRRSYGHRLRTEILKFFVSFTMNTVVIAIGVSVFYYIDNCYDVVMLPDPQKQYHELCQYIDSNHTFTLQNDSKIQQICQESHGYKPETIECEMSVKTMFKYYDLVNSIGFTIGYGRVFPVSNTAKIFFMVYATPSIAITMTLYMFCGEIVTILTELTIDIIRKRLFKCYHKRYVHAQRFLLLLINTLLLLTALSSVHKSIYPETSWLICFYYSMASVSTVGFGDVSFNGLEYYNAGPHFVVLSVTLFLLSMGTLASIISIINQAIVKKAAKMKKIASMSVRKRHYNQNKTQKTSTDDRQKIDVIRNSNYLMANQENKIESIKNFLV